MPAGSDDGNHCLHPTLFCTSITPVNRHRTDGIVRDGSWANIERGVDSVSMVIAGIQINNPVKFLRGELIA